MLRLIIRSAYLALLDAYHSFYRHIPSSEPAIVFAPHPDDETIGCGGTISMKTSIGAEVTVVYLTDGSMPNEAIRSINGQSISSLRRVEALNACSILGISDTNVIFLDYPDGSLSEYEREVSERIETLLRQLSPREIFMPYHRDRHPDHEATNRIVRSALERNRTDMSVFEYTTWHWRYWPLVEEHHSSLRAGLRSIVHFFRNTATTLRDMRCVFDIRPALDTKHAALRHHRSQMQRLGGKDWFILTDVSQGQWLDLFFRKYESFHYYKLFKKIS